MGQQQLLLIVLGVIVVGIAVVVGINLFNANAESATQDSIVSQATNIGAMAQQYYKKPSSMGGGNNSFVGFESTPIPTQLTASTDANFVIGAGTATQIVVTGTPVNTDYTWTTSTRVTRDSIITTIN